MTLASIHLPPLAVPSQTERLVLPSTGPCRLWWRDRRPSLAPPVVRRAPRVLLFGSLPFLLLAWELDDESARAGCTVRVDRPPPEALLRRPDSHAPLQIVP